MSMYVNVCNYLLHRTGIRKRLNCRTYEALKRQLKQGMLQTRQNGVFIYIQKRSDYMFDMFKINTNRPTNTY